MSIGYNGRMKRHYKDDRGAEKQREKFEKSIEKLKNDNAHSIQMQEYFKKIGTDKQSAVLSEWVNFITDLEVFKNMKHDVIMYGSETTISLLSNFLHYLYENSNSNPSYSYKRNSLYFFNYC